MMNKMCCVIIAWQSLAMLHLFSLLQPRPWCTHQSHSSGLKHSFPWVSGVLSAESLSENRRGRWEAHPTLCPFTEPLIAVDAGTPQDGPRLLFQLHSVQLLQVTWPASRMLFGLFVTEHPVKLSDYFLRTTTSHTCKPSRKWSSCQCLTRVSS